MEAAACIRRSLGSKIWKGSQLMLWCLDSIYCTRRITIKPLLWKNEEKVTHFIHIIYTLTILRDGELRIERLILTPCQWVQSNFARDYTEGREQGFTGGGIEHREIEKLKSFPSTTRHVAACSIGESDQILPGFTEERFWIRNVDQTENVKCYTKCLVLGSLEKQSLSRLDPGEFCHHLSKSHKPLWISIN